MRLPSLPVFLSAAVVLAACGGQSGAHGVALVPAAGKTITTQSAIAATSNTVVPISFAEFVACADAGAGEIVSLSGNLHELTKVTITPNNVHIVFTDNPQGVSGVGLTTGDKYRATGVTREDENIANAGFPATITYVDNFRIIGQGPGNNFVVHQTAHLTIDGNGTVIVDRATFTTACK